MNYQAFTVVWEKGGEEIVVSAMGNKYADTRSHALHLAWAEFNEQIGPCKWTDLRATREPRYDLWAEEHHLDLADAWDALTWTKGYQREQYEAAREDAWDAYRKGEEASP